jgi:TM2 domain-containing membrane protein YozV
MVNAILAAILSFIIPGLGQAIAGDIKKGIIFFIIALVLGTIVIYVLKGATWGYIIDLIYSIYAAYDAYQMAQ